MASISSVPSHISWADPPAWSWQVRSGAYIPQAMIPGRPVPCPVRLIHPSGSSFKMPLSTCIYSFTWSQLTTQSPRRGRRHRTGRMIRIPFRIVSNAFHDLFRIMAGFVSFHGTCKLSILCVGRLLRSVISWTPRERFREHGHPDSVWQWHMCRTAFLYPICGPSMDVSGISSRNSYHGSNRMLPTISPCLSAR